MDKMDANCVTMCANLQVLKLCVCAKLSCHGRFCSFSLLLFRDESKRERGDVGETRSHVEGDGQEAGYKKTN